MVIFDSLRYVVFKCSYVSFHKSKHLTPYNTKNPKTDQHLMKNLGENFNNFIHKLFQQ